MRDAFGGAFMIKLFLAFIFVYIVFTAIVLNYAKAFKVKDKVISYLEDNEIIDMGNMYASEYAKMGTYFEKEVLGKLNYRQDNARMNCGNNGGAGQVTYCSDGIKIIQMTPPASQTNKLGTYYRVETYFTWELSFLRILKAVSSGNQDGQSASGIWTISGETRLIVKE